VTGITGITVLRYINISKKMFYKIKKIISSLYPSGVNPACAFSELNKPAEDGIPRDLPYYAQVKIEHCVQANLQYIFLLELFRKTII